jgi:hypothetical protein
LAEAEAFIQESVAARLLISELEPTLTGDDYAAHLARVLRRLEAP